MAVNPDKISLLYNKISRASFSTLSSISMQLFNYLEEEIKDNPVYDQYENERKKWRGWIENVQHLNWSLPQKLEETKSLTYHLYKMIGEDNNAGQELAVEMFGHSKYEDNTREFNSTFIEYLGDVLKDIVNSNPELDKEEPKKSKGDFVFIVHGHDNELKRELQLLLQNAGINNVVLHEQVDKGRTIIDKLIGETENAGYAIALLTPDDITNQGLHRARQNVILEIGYFIGKLGKERIRMLTKGDIEIPSDLQGILYEKFDPSGAWKIKLLKEIQAVGIYVDIQSAISKF